MSTPVNALDTISAAASAIAYTENRSPQTSFQKRRWVGCWSGYWCFGCRKKNKRIGHAAFVPETTSSAANHPAPDNFNREPSVVLFPFVAPPSSPASFLLSEPHSPTQSPCALISFPSMPASIFTIGPYAHETQLVSPPVFSTYTTEPSTAPFTPPPESVHLTTPSSPEVPFAKFLDPEHRNVDSPNRFPLYPYDFQSYELQPGSPVSHLISPGSAISGSGASSPFPDLIELRTDESFQETFITASEDKEEGKGHQKNRSSTLGSAKEFNFDSVNGEHSDKTTIGSEWWANEKIVVHDSGDCQKWSFFPMMHQHVE